MTSRRPLASNHSDFDALAPFRTHGRAVPHQRNVPAVWINNIAGALLNAQSLRTEPKSPGQFP
jgi:hypothetical protein